MSQQVRVRFAPSPTGALHIGGIRTALYNYLFARQHKGDFLLRIEDTDQTRYVPGAEAYIEEALRWCGLHPDEGPGIGGNYGPYRQSERMHIYKDYTIQLVERGFAYYAFDSPEELDAMRSRAQESGQQQASYDHHTRSSMRNSLTMSAKAVQSLLESGAPYVIRLKVTPGQDIHIQDRVRGDVVFQSTELDDKVLLKSDGMPTYHLANVVDDHLMEITHVIRGEEWLPSTAHHVLLYRGFGWEDTMPEFAHLPLILKPDGKGKLSKRDGAKFGIPVFPLSWQGDTEETSFTGFREAGFYSEAMINFLVMLGWNPGTDQEIFSLEELVSVFNIDKIHKSGARFDFDKAMWFNQQYLMQKPNETLAEEIKPKIINSRLRWTDDQLSAICGLMKVRVHKLQEIVSEGHYFFQDITAYDEGMVRKKWSEDKKPVMNSLLAFLCSQPKFTAEHLESVTRQWLADQQKSLGDFLPLLRLGLAGTMKGPGVFEMMEILGVEQSRQRLEKAQTDFDTILHRPQ